MNEEELDYREYEKLEKKYEELQDRLNKAIEYIENDMSHCKSNGKLTRKALLEILRGEE